MTQLVSSSRGIGYVTALLALASACGGQSFTGNGGEAGSGATSQGGTTSSAGSHTTGGRAHAGSASGGSASAGSSSGGSGLGGSATGGSPAGGAGAGNEACDAPATVGDVGCTAAFQRWHHDPATGICQPIWYGGCGATKNNYESLAACQDACSGNMPDYAACKVPTDCVVTGAGCCGICDSAAVSAHDLIAYNKQYGVGLACGGGPVPVPLPGAGDAGIAAPVGCPACQAPAPGTGTLKYFVPDCVQGECVVEDVRESAVTACKVDSDCRLRSGTSCCESCNSTDVVAVRNDGSFEKLVCGDLLPPCVACLPGVPPGAIATCAPTGHCIVSQLLAGTDNTP